jgi:enoyl-CoA hydratase/carnithine racemase
VLLLQVIGHAAAERLLLSGSMVPPDRALQLGLVDELVTDKTQLLQRAEVSSNTTSIQLDSILHNHCVAATLTTTASPFEKHEVMALVGTWC